MHLRAIDTVADIFSKRNLWALSALMAGIQLEENAELRRALEFLFAGNVFQATRMQRYREAGGGFQNIGSLARTPGWRRLDREDLLPLAHRTLGSNG